jgi:hypothetical protein
MVVAMVLMESSTVLLRNRRRRSCYGMDEGRGAVL